MFSIDNTYFLLTAIDPYAQGASQRLIVPAIIFSIGAILLFGHLIIRSMITKKKLKEAEQLKRERIKRFSEEANIRYNSEPEVNLRTKKIVTETPTQGTPSFVNNSMSNSTPNMQGVTNVQSMANTQTMSSMPQNNITVPMNTGNEMQQNTIKQNPMQAANSIPVNNVPVNNTQVNNIPTMNKSSNIPSFSAAPQVVPGNRMTSNNNQNSMGMPSQPMMNGQVLPGMAAGVVGGVLNDKPEEKPNILELVKKTVAETEEVNREVMKKNYEEKYETSIDLKTNEINQTKEIEQRKENPKEESEENKIKEKISSAEDKKDEIKEVNIEKKHKFEYIPEYKPGTHVEKQDEEKTEKSDDTSIKEDNQDKLNENVDEEDKKDIKDVYEEKTDLENKKQKRIVMERSPEFTSTIDKNHVQEASVLENQTEKSNAALRKPAIPKVTSKKIEYNVGYIREVQNKLNASREYDKAISLKEREKEKLKEEFLEKRLKLEELKSELDEKEKAKADETKISLEDTNNAVEVENESKNKDVLNDEKQILYQQGKKISLFENVSENSAEDISNIDISKEDKKINQSTEEKIILEKNFVEKQDEERIEIKPQEASKKTHEEVKENKEIYTETKREIESEPENVNKNILNPNDELEKNTDKIQNLKSNDVSLEQEIKNVSKNGSDTKESSAVLSKIENLFSSLSITDEEFEDVDELNEETKSIKHEKEMLEKPAMIQKTIEEKDIKKTGINTNIQVNQESKNAVQEKSNNQNQGYDLIKEQIKNVQANNKEVSQNSNIKKEVKNEILKERPKMPQVSSAASVATVVSNINNVDAGNKKSKSILNGVDLDKEILSNKTKTLSTLKEAPNYKKIIAVVSPEKCGKTTVAVNLAYELANRGIKTCLIDTDNVKKDIYYYIHKEHIGCLSRLNEFDDAKEMYQLGIDVKDNLTVFTENKGIEFEINYSKLYKLIGYAQEMNDVVIIDMKSTLGQEKTKDLLKLSTNILFVIDKKITTLNRIADKFVKTKGGFINKDITLVVNMDEGRSSINKNAIRSIFKHLEYFENGIKKSYTIKTGEIFTVGYDTKAIITGLISQLPAVTVKENKILPDIKKIASHYYCR